MYVSPEVIISLFYLICLVFSSLLVIPPTFSCWSGNTLSILGLPFTVIFELCFAFLLVQIPSFQLVWENCLFRSVGLSWLASAESSPASLVGICSTNLRCSQLSHSWPGMGLSGLLTPRSCLSAFNILLLLLVFSSVLVCCYLISM